MSENTAQPNIPPATEDAQVAERNLAAFLANDANTVVTGVVSGVVSGVATAKVVAGHILNKGNDQAPPPAAPVNPPGANSDS